MYTVTRRPARKRRQAAPPTPSARTEQLTASLGDSPAARRLARGVEWAAGNRYSPETRDTYASDERTWERWCAAQGYDPDRMDPVRVAAFLLERGAVLDDGVPVTDDAGRMLPGEVKVKTIDRSRFSLDARAKRLGQPKVSEDEDVKNVRAALARAFGTRPTNRRDAVTLADVEEMIDACRRPRFDADRNVVLVAVAAAAPDASLANLAAVCGTDVVRVDLLVAELDVAAGRSLRRVRLQAHGGRACPVAALRRVLYAVGDGALFAATPGARALSREGVKKIIAPLRNAGQNPVSLMADYARPALEALRDEALLCVAYWTASRSITMTTLWWRHLIRNGDDWILVPGRLKGDPHNDVGLTHHIIADPDSSYCTAAALTAWYEVCCEAEGHDVAGTEIAVFRAVHSNGTTLVDRDGADTGITNQAYNNMIVHRAAQAGLAHRNLGSHSLRAGFITDAVVSGVPIADIMGVSGHKDPETVLMYLRRSPIQQRNAVQQINAKIHAGRRTDPDDGVELPPLPVYEPTAARTAPAGGAAGPARGADRSAPAAATVVARARATAVRGLVPGRGLLGLAMLTPASSTAPAVRATDRPTAPDSAGAPRRRPVDTAGEIAA